MLQIPREWGAWGTKQLGRARDSSDFCGDQWEGSGGTESLENVNSGQSDGPALTPAEQKPFVSTSNEADTFTAHQLAL